MNDERKANKTAMKAATWLVAVTWLCIGLVVFIIFSGYLSRLLYTTGLLPSKEDIAKKISWEPAMLPHQHCPNLSGKYENKQMVLNTERARREYEIWGDRLRSRLMDTIHSENGLRGDSFRMIHESPPSPSHEFPVEGLGKFEENTPVDVWHDEGTWTLSFSQTNDVLKLQRREIIDLNSAMIGCDGQDLIIRDVSIFESRYKGHSYWAFATEMRFRKLDDGNLQMTYDTRKWKRDVPFGLREMVEERKEALVFSNLSHPE
jgi:hypothetical protein